MKTRQHKKAATPVGMTAAQRRRLERREQLLERYEGASQAYADALAVLHALTAWVDDATKKTARARAEVHKARGALFAYNDKLAKASGGNQGLGEAIERWTVTMARATAAMDKALDYCEQSNKRIDEMERNATRTPRSRKARP